MEKSMTYKSVPRLKSCIWQDNGAAYLVNIDWTGFNYVKESVCLVEIITERYGVKKILQVVRNPKWNCTGWDIKE